MQSQAVYCPNCSSQVPAADINIDALLGKCTSCNHVFRLPLADAIEIEDGLGDEPSQPPGIQLEEGFGGELIIRRSWFNYSLFFLLFFCIAWDSFLIFWYSMAVFGVAGNNQAAPAGFDWLAIIFPIGHVAVGISLTYYVIAGFVNKTTIRVDRSMLTVRHHPIPWIGSRRLMSDEIQGIEIGTAYTQHYSHDSPNFCVGAHHIDSRQIGLLSGLSDSQSRYIAWHLAKRLEVKVTSTEPSRRRRLGWR